MLLQLKLTLLGIQGYKLLVIVLRLSSDAKRHPKSETEAIEKSQCIKTLRTNKY